MKAGKAGKIFCGLAAGAGLIALPFLAESVSEYYVYLIAKILVWTLFAMSFNLVLGYGGMMSFGHAAFFGTGAYTCALLLVKTSCPTALAFLAAPVAASIIGVMIGYFSVKIRGTFYFATLTLSFSQLIYILVYKWRSFTYGDDGIQGIRVPALISTLESYVNYYFFALAVTLACIYILWRITKSPFGLILKTMRENPERSSFIGVHVNNYRLVAFVISAFFSGVAGALFTLLETSVSPEILFWSASGEVILMGLLGGMHLFLGPALGAAIMVLLNSFLTSYTEHWGMFLGVTLVLIVLFIPQGVGGLIKDKLSAYSKWVSVRWGEHSRSESR
jgi:branched-chain amino acid transport system permease protein